MLGLLNFLRRLPIIACYTIFIENAVRKHFQKIKVDTLLNTQTRNTLGPGYLKKPVNHPHADSCLLLMMTWGS